MFGKREDGAVERWDAERCRAALRGKAAALAAAGEERFPRRSDFSAEEAAAIKAFLGPWPRALEAAGLKAARPADRLERNREKRRRAKIRRRESRAPRPEQTELGRPATGEGE